MARRSLLLIVLLISLLEASSAASAEGHARAILIGGSGGDEAYSRNIADWVLRFRTVLITQCGLKSDDVAVLLDPVPSGAAFPIQQSKLEAVTAAFEKAKKALAPDDQFILFLAGHGQVTEPVGKLSLPGPDLGADTLAAWLDSLPTQRIVIINAASGGAFFVKTCARAGRVLITASGVEADANQTYFGEFLVRGFEEKRADADKDGVVDLLEAYVYAARETANWYHRQHLLDPKAKLWEVHGKETRAIWKKLYAGTAQKLKEPDNQNDPDDEPEFGDFGPKWHSRRIMTEHAQLKDAEGEEAFSLWKPYEFEKPPAAGPGQLGNLARKTVLGRPTPAGDNDQPKKKSG